MRVVRRSWLALVTIGAMWPALAPAQGVSPGIPSAAGGAVAPAGASTAARATPTKTPTPVTAAKTGAAQGSPAGNASAGGSPVQGSAVFPPTPSVPPFILAEVFYYEPATGTKYSAWPANSWRLPIVDTMQAAGVTFLFDSNVPKGEISEIVEKKVCCYELRVAGQAAQGTTIAFTGEKIFVRGTVPEMQSWPKTIQLHLYHAGITASPGEASRASASGGGGASASAALSQAPISAKNSSAPIVRPFMDLKSTPATVQGKKLSYFATNLYPTFSHARCTDCHSMVDSATTRAQHAASGVPNVVASNPHVAGCGSGSCHNLVNDWRTPPLSKGINWKGKSAKEICGIVTSHLPSAEAMHTHFHDDPRVIWAVSSGWIPSNQNGKGPGTIPTAPPHNAQAWLQLVDYWINGGFPCPE